MGTSQGSTTASRGYVLRYVVMCGLCGVVLGIAYAADGPPLQLTVAKLERHERNHIEAQP